MRVCIAITVSLFIAAVGTNPSPQQQQQFRSDDADSQESKILQAKVASTPFRLSRGITDFGSKLYDLIAEEEKGNVIFSPFSLHTALSMTYFGSPENSQTHHELVQLLGLSKEFVLDYPTNFLQMLAHYENVTRTRPNTKVEVANKIYTDPSLTAKPDFLSLLRIFFKSGQEQVDFVDSAKASDVINRFVSSRTGGRIPDLLSPGDVDGLTRLVLINAIYFKANWQSPFPQAQTAPGDFKVNGETVTHREMMNVDGNFGIAEFPDFKVLEMPYDDENSNSNNFAAREKYVRMLVILPNEGVDVQTVEQTSLKSLNFSTVDQKMFFAPATVRFPKFKIGAKSELVSRLERLGVRTLFNPEQADLSDITSSEKVAVDKIVHQAQIEVNEEGSEAAAASGVSIGTRTVGVKHNFVVDRPFIFVVHDKAFDVPLFMGRLVDPTGGGRSLKPLGAQQQQQQSQHQQPQQQSQQHLSQRDASASASISSAEVSKQQQQHSSSSDVASAPCVENGFTSVANPSISFPCKGHETSVVMEHESRQREEQQIREAKFLERD